MFRNIRRLPILTRLLVALYALIIGACAGPDVRIGRPQPVVEPLPLATANGASDRTQERGILDDALRGATHDSAATGLVEALRRSTAHTTFIAGNRVQLLTDGPSTFAEFARAIANAKHHIHVETFIFADDKLGRSFANLLAEKSREGVEVRVLYDSIGSWAAGGMIFERMRAAGAQVQAFQPLNSIADVVTGRINQRDHRKILIVDGRVAFVGGINISGAYDKGSSTKPGKDEGVTAGWRDTQVRITGPVVQQFQALFFATWARSFGGAVQPATDYFPALEVGGSSLVAALASEYGETSATAIHAIYLAAVEAATRRVWITQAYFTPDTSLRESLVAAAQRGVDVRILLPGFSDSRAALSASRAIYAELLQGGVRIYEFEDALMHAKTAVVDETVALVGSANMDFRSLVENNEVTAVTIDAGFAAEMATAYLYDLGGATEITPTSWEGRPFRQRLEEKAASLLWRWL